MRSRVDVIRATLEWIFHVASVVLLVAFLAYVIGARRHGVADRVSSPELDRQLARWSTTAAPSRVDVALDHPPSGRDRDWLVALRGAGTRVARSSSALAATAISVEPRADPAGGVDMSVAAPESAAVMIADTLGVLDSARATDGAVRVYVPGMPARVDALVGRVDARAARRDSLTLKRLLVVGEAGWEPKFAVAALEERGWQVDAHLAVSPQGDVEQGRLNRIDTARYSAVLAIDTVAGRYARQFADFVRQGGGLVVWSPAARSGTLATVAPGTPGTPIDDDGDPPPDSAPRSVLALVPVLSLVPDAVVLERRGGAVAIAARRVGAGRVVEIGYTDSWRWEMAGGDDAPARYRDWVAGLVALVAYAPRNTIASPPADVAPLATLVDELGPAARPAERSLDPSVVARWVLGLVCAALILEWGSRRLRGMK